ncbi:Uma2 family endonuclease [Nocardia blacklockiae]|uniref:Uma2 family endonuclease n=1 Tax=Nocardia blacklockiae TaxID=480036 RepID=UPI0018958562|nr:Uma2 family endonuclease [Nocardia blacklockiae]MBF6171986.1 Uma2 family endonuclease [Nocardia blacklockiae]
MSEAFDWSWLRTSIPVIDMDMYLEMPEDLARRIEVKDGLLVHCESASPNHTTVARQFETAFRDSVAKRAPHEPCLRASGDLDMLVSEVPFHFKRPDAIVYRCIEEPRGKWKRKPLASDTLLVLEVVSPSSVTEDLIDKRAEYARLGIPHYWIVRMAQNDGPVTLIERFQLGSDGAYVKVGSAHRGSGLAVDVVDPIEVTLTWEQLEVGID